MTRHASDCRCADCLDGENRTAPAAPIPMVLHCPACGVQHIDKSEVDNTPVRLRGLAWDNPPHRSHLCHECGHVWRPADVATTGVHAIETKGKNDSPPIETGWAAAYAQLADKFSRLLDHATDGKISSVRWALSTMKAAVDEARSNTK